VMNNRYKVLIIEDSAPDRVLYRRYLSQDPDRLYQFEETNLGETALELCQAIQPDFILLDYGLPDMNGLEFLTALTDQRGNLPCPIIVLTGQGDETIATECMKRGAQDYQVKGNLTADSLCRSVHYSLQTYQMRLNSAILESITDPFFALDSELRFTYLNPQAEKFLRKSREEVLGRHLEQVILSLPQIIDLTSLKQVLDGGIAQKLERYITTRNIWLEINISPIKRGLSVYFQDITERKEAEKILKRYQLLSENALDIILFIRPDGAILEANRAAALAYGYSREELQSLNIRDLRTPETLALVATQMQEASSRGIMFETLHRRKDGTIFPVEVNSHGINLGDEQVLLSVIRDITERKRAEKALSESEERYRMLANYAADIIFEAALDGRLLYVSPTCRAVLGYEPEEMVGRSVLEFVHPEEVEQARKNVIQINAQPTDRAILVNQFRRKDGSYIWLETSFSLIKEPETELLKYYIGVSRDVTARKLVEEALSQSEARFQAFMDNSPTSAWIVDEAGKIIYLSQPAAGMFNMKAGEVIGKTVYGLLPKEMAEQVVRRRKKTLESGRAIEEVQSYPRPDGTLGYTLSYNFPLPNPSGQRLVGVIAANITERVRAEEALRESEERFRFLAENASDMIIRSTLEGICTYISPACRTQLGYEPEELIGQSSFEIIHPQDQPRLLENWTTLAKEGLATLTYRNRHKDGHYIWSETSIQTVCQPETGNPLYFTAISRNITERKKMEDALADEKERLDITLRSIGDGVVVTDAEGLIVLFNEAAVELTGYALSEVIGLPTNQILHFLDSQADLQPLNLVAEVLGGKQVSDLSGNFLLLTRQDHKRNVTCTGMPLYDKEANRIGAVVTFLDVTEKMKLAEESLRARNLESLGVLAGGIAHNFNNILTAIMGNISLARLDLYEPIKVNQLLEETEKASIRAKELAHQLLTFARGGSPHKERCKIETLIRDTTTYSLQGSRVRLEFDLPSNIWTVQVDQAQISQVIQNLVINAMEAMPEGGQLQIKALNVTLKAGQIPLLNQGTYVQITIQDRGSGIKPEDLSKILDPYFTTKFMGKGMGLPISYSIMRKHEGQMVVESEWGRGTTVHLYLPAIVQPTTDPAGKEDLSHTGLGRILLMDDEAMLRELVRKLLQKVGYEVDATATGEEALEHYQEAQKNKRPFSAVIADLMVPNGMGGQELIQKLLEIDPEVKALVTSGYSDDPVMANYREYGFSGAISKPFTLADLQQKLKGITKLAHKPLVGGISNPDLATHL